MQRLLLLSIVFACATANAQVYKRVGPDGKIYFSDRPGPDATRVEVAPAQTISLPTVSGPAETVGKKDEAVSGYSEFAIVSPLSDEGVRANDGNVTVRLSLQPKLQSGHTIMLKIDGEDGAQVKAGDDMAIELTNLSRGRHTVEAVVVDAQGNALIQTASVSFNVLRVAGAGR
jgi:hypothetical protein